MKAPLLLVLLFLALAHTGLARAAEVPSKNSPRWRFKMEIIDWNRAERIFKGALLYVRTDHYIKVFNFPGYGRGTHLLYSKKISKSRKSTIELSNLMVDYLKDSYFSQCAMPASEEYTVTFRNSTSYKTVSLHHYYWEDINHAIELVNDGVPEQFKLKYLSKAASQDCTTDTIGQAERARMRKFFDSSFITISANKFDYYVDSCTALLDAKKLSEISDSGHIYIILCANTIFYTRVPGSFQQRFIGGRYDRFNQAILTTSYTKNITNLYPSWLSTGSGLYFPRWQIEYGGLLKRHSLFSVVDPIIEKHL